MTDTHMLTMADEDRRYRKWGGYCLTYHNQWIEMLTDYCGETEFIREFATKHGRMLVTSVQELKKRIIHYGADLRRNLYVSVYAFREQKEDSNLPVYTSFKKIDKIVFDIDAEDGLRSGRDLAFRLARVVTDKYNGSSKVLFTGGKGFHVYFIPSEPYLNNNRANKICQSVNEELDEPEILDERLFGDVSRSIRIPYTLHPRTGRQMIPVTADMSMGTIIDASEKIIKPEPIGV